MHPETIAVKGGAPVLLDVRWTIWGPIVGLDHNRREQALKWVAHDPRVLSTDAARIAQARSVDEALQLAVGAALAAQNLLVGDRDGHIAWTIYGAVPRRIGFAGDVPTSWADGTHRWDGYLGYDEHPRVVDPPDGRLWTANARVVGGEMLQKIGDGGYSDGIRAWMIRENLQRLDQADERALFDIALDNRSLFLDRWRTVLLAALTPEAAAAAPLRTVARQLVDGAWTGRTSADSAAYRIVRNFRLTASRMAFDAITGAVHGGGRGLRPGNGPPHRRAAVASGPRASGPSARPAVPDLGRLPARRPRPHAGVADGRRQAVGRSHLGRGQRRRHRAPARRRGAVGRALPVDAARRRCPATPTCRACSRRVPARPNASSPHPDTKPPASCTCRAGRAAIRCRRISAINSARGSTARRCRCCRASRCTF